MRPRNVKFQNHNENADRHLFACALRWRPFYAPKDFTVTEALIVPAADMGKLARAQGERIPFHLRHKGQIC